MTAALQRSVARYFGELSQIILDSFSEKNIRKYYYDLLQESTWLCAFYYNDNMNFYVLIFKTFPFLKIFVTLLYKRTDVLVVNEWGTSVWYYVSVTNSVSRNVANSRIGGISSNLKKIPVFSIWPWFATWENYLVILSKYCKACLFVNKCQLFSYS